MDSSGRHHPRVLSDPGKEYRSQHGVPVVPAFDGYRAFAIMSIVLLHVITTAGVTARAGGSAGGQLIWGTLPQFVDILFVVSGFVVFLPTVAAAGRFGSVGSYAIRRAARLLPAFWLSLVVLLIAIVAVGASGPDLAETGLNILGLQSIAAMIDPDLAIGFGINLPLWTLTVEITFYVLLAVIATSYYRHPILGLAIAAAVSIVWREGFAHLDDLVSVVGAHPDPARLFELRLASGNQLPSWLFSFACGMTGAWAFVRLRRDVEPARLASAAKLIAIGALAALAICVVLAGRYALDNPFPLPALIARESWALNLGYSASLSVLMVSLALAPRRMQFPFALPVARRLGDISYGVYLIHTVVMFVILSELSLPTDGSFGAVVAWFALVVPVSLVYGYLSARFFEQPIRRWARRYGRRTGQPAVPAGAHQASESAGG